MNTEFDFIDLYYLNDVSNEAKGTNEFQLLDDNSSVNDCINISGIGDDDVVSCTYAKFLEILDTQGLEGLVNI